MGTISINPDADGDLHSAALHNDKFQTILNEINGNLDASNLANPNCIIPVQFSASRTIWRTNYDALSVVGPIAAISGLNLYPYAGWGYTHVGIDRATQLNEAGFATPGLTSYASQMLPQIGTNACNVYMNSFFRNTTGGTMTLLPGPTMWYQGSAIYNAANVVVYMQKSTTFDGATWVDMASASFDPNAGLGGGPTNLVVNGEAAFSTVLDAVLPANSWFRVLVQNNAGTALSGNTVPPPVSGGTAFFKALCVA